MEINNFLFISFLNKKNSSVSIVEEKKEKIKTSLKYEQSRHDADTSFE